MQQGTRTDIMENDFATDDACRPGNNAIFDCSLALAIFKDKFDDDTADVYTIMQRLFLESSEMKKTGFENMKMSDLKRSAKLAEGSVWWNLLLSQIVSR